MGGSRRCLVSLAVAALLAVPAAASAADPAAEALFDEGLALFEAGDFAAACPKLASAVALTKGEGLGGMLLLAECREKTGKLATAWGLYRTVAARAARAGQTERMDAAERGASRVSPLLHRAQLVVPPELAATPGVAIVLGEDPLPREGWSSAFPVDAGELVLRVTAPGHVTDERRVAIPAEAGTTTIDLQPLAPSAASAPPPAPAPEAPVAAAASTLGPLGIAGLVTTGVGLTGLGASLVMGLVARSQWSDAHSGCDGSICADQADVDGVDDARSLAHAGTAVFVVGAVLTAAGATMVVVDLADGEAAAEARGPTVRVSVGPGHVAAGGTF